MKNSINLSMFFALKVSEKSGVPVLFLSNPGVGKTTTVQMFADIRGYKMLLLRGNSTTAEEINGYDTAGAEAEKRKTAVHLRPSWFDEILKNSENGQKTLLFLDEISTTNESVQAALLHLVLDRKVDREDLPKDTLVVAAGNYAQNLSDTMNMLPPTMNRFAIYNIELFSRDLGIFMNKYSGSITGKKYNYLEDLRKTMEQLDSQEKVITSRERDIIGEYIENSIKDTIEMLCEKDKSIDFNVKEIKNIYSETSEDASLGGKVYGFVTPRTMVFLREMAIETYLSFGKEGICGSNFLNLVDGLCGIGLTKDHQTGDVKMKRISMDIFKELQGVVNDIDKMNSNKLPHYTDFLKEVLDKGTYDVPTFQAITNKLKELNRDQDLDNISRPIENTMIQQLYNSVRTAASKLIDNASSAAKEGRLKDATSEEAIKLVNIWNTTAELLMSIGDIVFNKKFDYNDSVKTQFENQPKRFNLLRIKAAGVRTNLVDLDPAIGNIIPEVKAVIVKK